MVIVAAAVAVAAACDLSSKMLRIITRLHYLLLLLLYLLSCSARLASSFGAGFRKHFLPGIRSLPRVLTMGAGSLL